MLGPNWRRGVESGGWWVGGQNSVPNFEPDRLRDRRLSLGLTQDELAVLAGLHPRTVVQYENGHRVPYSTTLAALAKALGAAPIDLTRTSSTASLAQLRINAGLTQQAAAERAQLLRSGYSKIERGEVASVTDAVIARLADTYGVSPEQVRSAHAQSRAHYLASR
jgi:transcriptional regulator with XRE-family HTH domain